MRDTRTVAIASFLAVFVLVVAAGAVVGFAASDDSGETGSDVAPDHIEVSNPQYDAERVTSDMSPGSADIELDSTATDTEVVVHVGGDVTERDVEPLVNALVESDNEVTVVAGPVSSGSGTPITVSGQSVDQVSPPPNEDGESLLTGQLDDAHGLVSVGVGSYTDSDLEAIDEFVEDDGRVVMAVDPTQEFARGEGHSQTYSELGVYTEPGYVYNLAENDLNYQRIFAEPDGDSMLTEGVDRVVFDSATPVRATSGDETMVPIAGSELSVTRVETEKPVLVRDGDVALVGDTRFMTPENTLRADNDALVGNIAEFLVESDRVLDDRTEEPTQNDSDTVTVEVGPDGENRFDPQTTEIEPGTTVRFEWKSDGHNVVPVFQDPPDAEWNGVEETQTEGFVHEFTFEEEGVHEFVSEPHEDDRMYGAIVVGDP